MARVAATLVAALAAAWAPGGAVHAQSEPPAPVLEVLRQGGVPRDALAFAILPLEPREAPALGWQAERSMAPGSTMKLVTSVVALDRLGPAHRGQTEVWTRAPLAGDVLMGDVVLRAGADPDLGFEQVGTLLLELRHAGIREIAGDIVLDRNLYQPARADVDAPPFDEQPEFPYNVIPDALNLAGNLLRLELRSDAATGVVQARALPELPLLRLDARGMRPTRRPCSAWDDDWKSPPSTQMGSDGTLTVLLRGGFPRGCKQQTWLNLIDRNQLAERLLRWHWTQLGGRWNGTVREATQPVVAAPEALPPALARLLPVAAPYGSARRGTAPTALASVGSGRPAAIVPGVPATGGGTDTLVHPAGDPTSAPAGAADGPADVGATSPADAALPPSALLSWRLLARHEARPWGELLRPLNKQSDNVLARLLYLELSRSSAAFERTPPAPTVETSSARSARVIRQWFEEQRIPVDGLVTDNGSGLSRLERITPQQQAAMLQVAGRGRWAPDLMASLPLAGIDGTLRNRLRDSPAGGWARLKTGYLRDAVGLAGYVRDEQGRTWVLAAMVNHERTRVGRQALDTLVDWLARGGADGAPAPLSR